MQITAVLREVCSGHAVEAGFGKVNSQHQCNSWFKCDSGNPYIHGRIVIKKTKA